MKKNIQRAWLLCSICIAAFAMLNGCGSNTGGGVTVVDGPSGTLVQGPVSGATVWADRLTTASPSGNGSQDADELFTTTDSKGDFRYTKKPDYPYISRSKGGTDTVTNQPALPLAAPAGSNTITPITTLVASLASNADGSLSPAQVSLADKIETIMGGQKFDSDPSKKTTPAALALTKSIEMAMTVASNAASSSASSNGGTAPTAAQTTEIEKVVSSAVVAAIAAQIASPTTTTATLSSASTLATAVSTATQAAATTLTTNQATSHIVFYDTAVIAASVQTAVTTVATDIAVASGQSALSMGTTANSFVAEATIIQPLVTSIQTAQSIATESTVDSVTASVPTAVADTTPPVLSAFSPLNGATLVPVKTTVTVSFTKEMDPATLTAANLKIDGPGGPVPLTIGYSSLTNTATLNPNADLSANTTYTVTVAAAVKDLSAKLPLAAAKTWSFTTAAVVDTVAPTATVVPADAAVSVNIDASVTATFDKSVTPATVTSTNFSVTRNGVVVPGTVRYTLASRVATFVPALPLSLGTTYTVRLSGITSDSGTAMAPKTTTFTTWTNPDTVKPTVTITTNPAVTSNEGISTSASFVATFSKKLDPATINGTTFTLKYKAGTGSEVIPGTVAYNAVTSVATFTPSAALPTKRIVIATVTTGVADSSGNTLAAPVSKEFTTESLSGSTGGNAF